MCYVHIIITCSYVLIPSKNGLKTILYNEAAGVRYINSMLIHIIEVRTIMVSTSTLLEYMGW